ncbi:OLC1v1008747C1 [Oldenlandia corymbosa var. corymbosa]|uniref:OLC1v1008747C1 n=1 Tax=Oldenlandia corymbosa var. corymbosa TaxID=529605 RepID=A0AAV1DME7_OLDCO|nr:OLC1v1008747C1 [Oldenlandia corymbosa var. corymbosa]
MGNVMDSAGRWKGALEAFEEAYRIASEASIASAQLSALKNMHYSYMIRYDEDEKARMLQISINNLKHSTKEKKGAANICSETEEKIESQSSGRNEVSNSSDGSLPNSSRSNSHSCPADLNEDAPLISLLHHGKKGTKFSTVNQAAIRDSIKLPAYSPKSDSTSAGIQAVGCKRRRAVPTDCQEEENRAARRPVNFFHEDEAAASTALQNSQEQYEIQEESSCAHRPRTSAPVGQDAAEFRCSNNHESENTKCGANASENMICEYKTSDVNVLPSSDESCSITIKMEGDFVHLSQDSFLIGDKVSIEEMKVIVACLYHLQLPSKKRESGLVPVVKDIKYDGRTLQTLEATDLLKNHQFSRGLMEGSVGAWVSKPVMKNYIDCCKELSVHPSLKVLKNLYSLEVSEL